MGKLFDYKALSAPPPAEDGPMLHGSYTMTAPSMSFETVANLERDIARLPIPGEIKFINSEASYNAFTFISLISRPFPIKELHVATYSINRKAVDALIQMHDSGMIEQMTIFVNDGILYRNPLTMDSLKAMAATRPNIKVLLAWSHAKITLVRTHDFYFVVEGSGNLSNNAQYEQYIFANDKGAYDYRMKLFTESNLKKY